VTKKEFIVTKENSNQRLDTYASSLDAVLSRSMCQKLIKENLIKVNGKNVKESYKVTEGDKIEITLVEPTETYAKPENIPLDVIYEDNDILVINKPKGMVVHPGNGNTDGTLVNAVLAYAKGSLSGIGGEIRPGIVHRLDKDTSGLIIVAKNDKAHINMSNEIKNHEVTKIYTALVKGNIVENEATIDMPIARSKQDRKKMFVDKDGKSAITHIKVIKRYGKYTLLRVKIDTGRTHQIRVHLSYIGHPIYNDALYGFGKMRVKTEEQVLQSYKLKFIHPFTNEQIEVEIEPDEKIKKVLCYLESK